MNKEIYSESEFALIIGDEIKNVGLLRVVRALFENHWDSLARRLAEKKVLTAQSLTDAEWKTAFGWSRIDEISCSVTTVLAVHLGIPFEHVVARVFNLNADPQKRMEFYEEKINSFDSSYFLQPLVKCLEVELGLIQECCRQVIECHRCSSSKREVLTPDEWELVAHWRRLKDAANMDCTTLAKVSKILSELK